MNAQKPARSAFTLIELLVVVAIIALLISILLPSLSRAKEQARIATCLTNLRNIGQAANAYLLEFNNIASALPNGYPVDGVPTQGFSAFTSHIWGGGRPNKTSPEWLALAGNTSINPVGSDVYRIRPSARIMNPYLSPQVSWSDPRRDQAINRIQIPMDLPGFFKCPSATSVTLANVNGDDEDAPETELAAAHWEWWGNSYSLNWGWEKYFREAPPGNDVPYNSNTRRILGVEFDNGQLVPGLSKRVYTGNMAGGFASRFILIQEARAGYAFEASQPRGYTGGQDRARNLVGWHRQLDRHVMVFLDGHAEYKQVDTRYVDGPGYTIWPNRPWQGQWTQYQGN